MRRGRERRKERGREIGRFAYTSLTFMNCSRAVLSSFLSFVFLPSVSSRDFLPFRRSFYAKAKFYRVDELACMLKAHNESVMNTNRVRKIEVIFGHNGCTFQALRFVDGYVNEENIVSDTVPVFFA